MSSLDILCVTPSSSGGWGPVTSMAALAGQLFETEPTFWHPARAYGRVRKVVSMLPQARRGGRALLLIASHPGDLLAAASMNALLGRYSRIGAWVFDSFWDERIPLFARWFDRFDTVWITDGELVPTYAQSLRSRVDWLPWGTDALSAARRAHDTSRGVDVLRLGRQPEAWDDDTQNAPDLAQRGLTYRGRFPDDGSGTRNQEIVEALLSDSKVVLASSPLANPSSYTHPTRDYVSARFTDAAAAGAVVVGQPPQCMAADLLPEGLLVSADVTSFAAALDTIESAVNAYTPERAAALRRGALRTLDWRHRFARVAATLDVQAPALRSDLDLLDEALRRLA